MATSLQALAFPLAFSQLLFLAAYNAYVAPTPAESYFSRNKNQFTSHPDQIVSDFVSSVSFNISKNKTGDLFN